MARITYIHQYFKTPDQPGGGRSWEFARRLVADGHQVTVICAGPTSRRYEAEGVQVVQAAVSYRSEMSLLRRAVAFVHFLLVSTVLATRHRADVVFATSTPLTVAVPGIIAAFVRRTRFVFEVRDLWPDAPIELGLVRNPALIRVARWLEWFAYRRADQIIALSPGMAEGVKRVAPAAHVTVIPNASDFELFEGHTDERVAARAEYGWDQDEVVLLYAGSFGKIYGLDWLVDVGSELADDPIRLVVVGDGATMAELTAQASALGLDPETLLLGRRVKNDVARMTVAADATVSCLIDSTFLGMSSLNKAFDAMAAAKPMFFNHGGWLADLAVDRQSGWVLSRDPRVAAGELRVLCGDLQQLSDAGKRNAELGRECFDRDTLYREFAEVVVGGLAEGD